MSQDVTSFVLRFVREAGAHQEARWRGTVKHVQGATERQFTRVSEALEFIQQQLAEASEQAPNPWLETARLWGESLPQLQRAWLERLGEAAEGASRPAEWRRGLNALWSAPEPPELSAQLAAIGERLEQLARETAALREEVRALTAKRDA